MAIKDFEHSSFEIAKENHSLKYQLELKDDEIDNLKSKLTTKDKVINRLQAEKEKLKQELQKFKGFWQSIMKLLVMIYIKMVYLLMMKMKLQITFIEK